MTPDIHRNKSKRNGKLNMRDMKDLKERDIAGRYCFHFVRADIPRKQKEKICHFPFPCKCKATPIKSPVFTFSDVTSVSTLCNPGPGETFIALNTVYFIIRSQEKNLNQNRDSNLGPPDFYFT